MNLGCKKLFSLCSRCVCAVVQCSQVGSNCAITTLAIVATGYTARLALYQQALGRYVGEYLPSENGDWVLEQQEEHKAAHVRASLEVPLPHFDHGPCEA
jgi:hypothetical protein